jgi:ubiquinone/menaquinone biosynthesis C-methylase UbiE
MLLERVAPRSHMTILDVGAGTGWLSVELAERCGPETTVIAVDPWRSGLDRLRQKVTRLGLSNVVVLEGDASVLDLASASIDLIVSNLGVNNFDNPSAVLATCFRVAKGGATFCLTTNPVGHMAEFYDEFTAVLASLGQHDRLPVLETHISHRGTPESLARMLIDAGFAVDHSATQAFHLRFADGSALLRHHFIRLAVVQGWAAVAEPTAIDVTFDHLERRLNAVASARGGLTLTVPTVCLVAHKPEDGV